MNLTFLPEIGITTYTRQSQGLSSSALSYFGNVFTKVDQSTIEEAFEYLKTTTGAFLTFFEVSGVDRIDQILSLLDSGAAGVFVNQSQFHRIRNVESIPWDRVVLITAGEEVNELLNSIEDTAVRLFWPGVSELKSVQNWLDKLGSGRPQIFISLADPQEDLAIELSELKCVPILPATLVSTDSEKEPQLISASKLFLKKAITDRTDGLFTTLVTDERDVALGVVYSNADSVAASLRTGMGVYYSRKRGLWHKGATSGDTQELVRVALDCDGDCLRYTVRQKGRGRVAAHHIAMSRTNFVQAFATWGSLHVSVLIAVYHVYRKHSSLARLTHQKTLTLLDCSKIRSF
jgi:phosphoribosyl-ATP pyrophosphohydrolase / phosphoribosyl-AMP cyclohydrolase / histidinol dehydrogenase